MTPTNDAGMLVQRRSQAVLKTGLLGCKIARSDFDQMERIDDGLCVRCGVGSMRWGNSRLDQM